MNITEIKITNCVPFEGNPFQIHEDHSMEMLTDSIRESGVLVPVAVRTAGNGSYEIISGHRRIHACEKLGIETVPALVTELDRDSAVIFMVDSNLQRESLLPSEKAFAYKMKLEALKHQGRTSDQLGQKSSVQTVADASSDSKTQVQRYIRLTNLEKPLLDLVDEGRIALTPAVELSYLLPEEQRNLIQTIESEDCTPSLSQSVRMRKLSAEGLLTMDRIFEIMTEVKGNQVEVIKIPTERVRRFFKPTTSYRQMEDYIVKALEYYARYLQRQRDRDSR